jgi:hypothetical protein
MAAEVEFFLVSNDEDGNTQFSSLTARGSRWDYEGEIREFFKSAKPGDALQIQDGEWIVAFNLTRASWMRG